MSGSHDESPTAETPEAAPRASRWRVSTWFVAGFVLLVMALWNDAAFVAISHDFTFQRIEYPPDVGGSLVGCLEHGWPWTYARREETVASDWDLRTGLLDFYPAALLRDAVVALLVAVAVGWLCERWRNKQTRWYQAGLGTLLMLMFLVGLGLNTYLKHRRANEIVKQATPTLSLEISSGYLGPVSLAGKGLPLPVYSNHAKPIFITVGGYAITPTTPHPGPFIKSIVEMEPAACRVAITLTKYENLYDWLEAIPIEEFYCRVEPDAKLTPLKRMPRLRRLWMTWPVGADKKQLSVLGELPNLELLAITGNGTQQLGDDDFAFLDSLKQLRVLAIAPSHISAAVLENIVKLKQLRTLCLPGCRLTDDDLQKLSALKELRRLEIDSDQVTDNAIERLEGSCPWLTVVRLNQSSP